MSLSTHRSNGSVWPSQSLSWSTSLVSLLLAGLSLGVASALAWSSPLTMATNGSKGEEHQDTPQNNSRSKSIRFACLGNSMQYFNDCPRLLARMFQLSGYHSVDQNSCLRGGASLISLWEKGNGMQTKFGTDAALLPDGSYDIGAPTVPALLGVNQNDNNKSAAWDVCIMNDHTQSPARQETRLKTIQALEQLYAPLLLKSNTIPILIMTPAYRLANIRGTDDLGSFEDYTESLREGLESYKSTLDAVFEEKQGSPIRAWIAPVGLAFATLRQSYPRLWEKLYHTDDFHPSPHGTLLQAYVLFYTITAALGHKVSLALEKYDPTLWWEDARRMQPADEPPLPRPALEEAKLLRKIAFQVCRDYNDSDGGICMII